MITERTTKIVRVIINQFRSQNKASTPLLFPVLYN